MATPDQPTAPAQPCGTCGQPATQQWQRAATDAEAAAHWDAVEQNIRASGNPDYTQDRTDTVTKAVFGCAEHGE